MSSPTKPLVVCLTHNNKLYKSIEAGLEEMTVTQVTQIDELNQLVKLRQIDAIIVHMANAAGKVILGMLKTGQAKIPRFVILSPSYSKGKDLATWAEENEVVAAIREEDGVKSLASLIESRVMGVTRSAAPEDDILAIHARIGQELVRLLQEYHVTGMRTLPQPNVGGDTKLKLQKALEVLRGLKINP